MRCTTVPHTRKTLREVFRRSAIASRIAPALAKDPEKLTMVGIIGGPFMLPRTA